jgi:hypothetical protein
VPDWHTSQAGPFDVGADTDTPVVEGYADRMPFKFTGTLEKVPIDLK